jgi:hypothetical protein
MYDGAVMAGTQRLYDHALVTLRCSCPQAFEGPYCGGFSLF